MLDNLFPATSVYLKKNPYLHTVIVLILIISYISYLQWHNWHCTVISLCMWLPKKIYTCSIQLPYYHPYIFTTVQSPEKMFKCNVSFPTFLLTHLKKFFMLSFAIVFFPSVYRSRLTLTQCHSLASYTMKSPAYTSLLKKLPLSQKKKKTFFFLRKHLSEPTLSSLSNVFEHFSILTTFAVSQFTSP